MIHRLVCVLGAVLLCTATLSAQKDPEAVAVDDDVAAGLDLTAVSEVFRDSKDLEDFEKRLNDPDAGVNNLDLDRNGDVDFLRVVEQGSDDTRLVILQAVLGENEFQDVATIEVEKTDTDQYNMQVRGNEELYGPNYYIVPAVHVHLFPVVTWMYRPLWRPYVSVWRVGVYPRWWRPWRPVGVTVYRTRTVHLTTRASFTVSRTSRVTTVHKVHYTPHRSTMVRSRTTVTKSPGGKVTVRKSTTTRRRR
ncbi:MAG: hypothetical protein HY962_09870 [Ignavibacteriae bacterium]|nr:hypothetical protein [Ignavibacteriota bacterium]